MNQQKTKKNPKKTTKEYGETRCVTCQNGWKNLRRILWRSKSGIGKHSIFTHLPKERNCDICLRTKITRAPCRKRTGTVVPRAEHFGDLITADHKIHSEECESRNNHRYAVVVRELATQRIQSYPCKAKTSQETQKSLQKFLKPTRKPKVIYTDNSLRI